MDSDLSGLRTYAGAASAAPAGVSITPADAIALFDDESWRTTRVTYGFPEKPGDYGLDYVVRKELNSFAPFPEASRDVVRKVMEVWSSVTGLTLVEAAPGEDPDIRFGVSTHLPVAWAYHPGPRSGGDIWFNITKSYFGKLRAPDNGIVGAYEWATLLHEIGHALGLKHGHEASHDNPYALPAHLDGLEYSVMTYRSYVGDKQPGPYNVRTWSFPQTPMVLDLVAMQKVYGTDTTTRAGDTVYKVDPVKGLLGSDSDSPNVFRTIWDAGGRDRFDLSAYKRSVHVDLRPGQVTDLSPGGTAQKAQLGTGVYAPGHLFTALDLDGDGVDPRIEDAVGGSAADRIIGNAKANRIQGGPGADELWGLGGADVFAGTPSELDGDQIKDFTAPDRLRIDGVLPLSLTDTGLTWQGATTGVALAGQRFLASGDGLGLTVGLAPSGAVQLASGGARFFASDAAAVTVVGGDGDDVIVGGAKGDVLSGGAGSDQIVAQGGDDLVMGGAGSDYLSGGAGADTFVIRASGPAAVDTIADFDAQDRVLLVGATAVTTIATDTGVTLSTGTGHFVVFEGLAALPKGAVQQVDHAASVQLLSRGVLPLTEGDDRHISSGAGDQWIDGLAGADIIVTGRGNDTVLGGDGSDQIVTGAGNDWLTGGAGNDVLAGGAGADVFVFSAAQGQGVDYDTVLDFDPSQDRIKLIGGTAGISADDVITGQNALIWKLSATQFVQFDGLTDVTALTGADFV